MAEEEANNLLALAQENEISLGASVHVATLSYNKESRLYSILLPGYEPRLFSYEQARAFLVAYGHYIIIDDISEWPRAGENHGNSV